MPRYEYMCGSCGRRFELNLRMADYRRWWDCPRCSKQAERIYTPDSAPYIINDIVPYHDKGLGMDIHSRSERRAIMKQRGLVEAGDDKSVGEAEEVLGEKYDRENRRPPEINK
jgi:putative FmdB family regulatory protein